MLISVVCLAIATNSSYTPSWVNNGPTPAPNEMADPVSTKVEEGERDSVEKIVTVGCTKGRQSKKGVVYRAV